MEPNQELRSQGCFQQNLAFGQAAESDIARWLLSRGNTLLPIYDIEYKTGKGPRVFSGQGEFVAPDFLVFTNCGDVYWVEAKHKNVFSWHRKSGTWTTGIDLRHYNQYRRLRDRLRLPVWLFFLHESSVPSPIDRRHNCPSVCPTGLFAGELSYLEAHENHKHMNWASGMVYWAKETLKRIPV